MTNQYCKVGSVNALSNDSQGIDILKYQYQNFVEKASTINDAKLVEFFELKAQKIQKTLESLL